MRNGILFFTGLLTGLLTLGATSHAQLADRVNQIDGFVLEAEETAYFNAEQCATPASTTYQLRISTETGSSVTNVYLWAGRENGQCNLNDNRTDIQANCREIAGNPRTVEPDNLISDLTLQELIDTGVVTCETSGLQGTPYEIFAFRNSDPGSTDVPESDYGIADINVDVSPPNELNLQSNLTQVGQNFSISWSSVTDDIWIYRFYENDVDDPTSATILDGITAGTNATSRTLTAAELGMAVGDTKYVYVAAQDRAFQLESGDDGGNTGPLSTGTQVNAVETTGVCGATDGCTGCSIAPMSSMQHEASTAAALLGLALACAAVWRRRR